MLALAFSYLTGCATPPSASEEKLNPNDTKAALDRKGYKATQDAGNTDKPRENGNIVEPIDVQSPTGARYPDYLEKKSGHTTDTTYVTTSPALANDKYSI